MTIVYKRSPASSFKNTDTVMKVIEDSALDGYLLHELVEIQFSGDGTMREKLWMLIWQHRKVFKGFAHIKSVQYKNKSKKGANPICCP